MKKIVWLCCLVVSFLIVPAIGKIDMNQKNNNVHVDYVGNFKFNYMHCIYRINGLLFNTTNLVTKSWKPPSNKQWSEEIGILFHEGENILEIEGIQLPVEPEDGSKPYCELTVYATATDRETGETDGKVVTHLKLTLDKDGKFTTEESQVFTNPSVTDSPILIETNEKAITGFDWLNNDHIIRRSLYINHTHRDMRWTQAEIFEETPKNIAKLWMVYDEFTSALTQRDETTLSKLLRPAAKERDQYDGYTGNEERKLGDWMALIQEGWEKRGFTPSKIDRKNYELERATHGKLFRFNYKGGFNASPIRYDLDGGKSYGTYNFYFTEIDGQIRVGIL
ncbi:MAG TPA: hypothetical protein VIG45_05140 [Erysipelothrix sp.]